MEIVHQINILVHVLCGTIALIVGFGAIFTSKGSKWHIRFGQYFKWTIAIVILTGLIGVFVFKRNNFLLVITLLSGYTCFSGIRAIKLKGQKPQTYDYVIALTVISSALYYLYYINSIGMYWAPAVTYSTIGALFIVTFYDLSKVLMPVEILKKAFMYEHVYKMISAFIAITSAFAGTVFPDYKPYSQLVPSLFGFAYIIAIFIKLSTNRNTVQECTPL
jgi:hypothetical protein